MRSLAPERRLAVGAALWCGTFVAAACHLWPVAVFLMLAAPYVALAGIRRWYAAERERAVADAISKERAAGRRLSAALVQSLATAVEAKTGGNLGHVSRVQAYACEIARTVGADAETMEALENAAMLHEIGRLGVPDNLLTKRGRLTAEERDKVRAYPAIGERILAPVPFTGPVCAIVRHHQERFDGQGYPFGIAGSDIPLGARILAVADSYDTLVSSRAGRPGLSHDEALERIRAESGSQFDPAVVTAFARVVARVNERVAGNAAPGPTFLAGSSQDIARAQKEVTALQTIAASVGSTLDLDASLHNLVRHVRELIPSSLCAVFLLEPDGKFLQCEAAEGVNEPFFRGSRAQVGTYVTGKVVSRGMGVTSEFVLDDILPPQCIAAWTNLRSMLVAPLVVEGRAIGTINAYSEQADAFSPDQLRLLTLIGEMAGRGVENARLFAKTQQTAFTDPLTGLHNARYLRHFLEQEMNRARKNGHRLSVLGLDLDQFKPVNDNYGHERGDELLKDIARLLERQVRNYDVLSRYAGDEFVLVLPETERNDAALVARKIQRAMDRFTDDLRHRDPGFPAVGASIGVAVFPEDAETLEGLLAHADQAMYEDKRSRRMPRAA